MNSYDLFEPEIPAITFGEIIKNPIAVIFYFLCLWILVGWVVYSISYFKTALRG